VITTVWPEFSAEGTVMSTVHGPEPVIEMFPVATAEPPEVAVVYPAVELVVYCCAVQFAATTIDTCPFAATPPVVAVYVSVSVVVVAAVTDVGVMFALPDPSAELFTLTDGEPAVRSVRVPPELAFCCTVHVAAPAFAAEGAVAPGPPPEVSP
jgi:hypothetical protein